jgi:hypothetical protein
VLETAPSSKYSNPLTSTNIVHVTLNTQGMSKVGMLNTPNYMNVGTAFNVSGITKSNSPTTFLSTLNVVGDITTAGLSVISIDSNINVKSDISTAIFNYCFVFI